ncbi:MAG: hypothetical protein WDO13_00075 [Verrucomicrobiota bacterium]
MPDHLARRSDLAFVCGPAGGASGLLAGPRVTAGSAVFFAAPEGATQAYAGQGLARLLNAEGYFVEFGDDTSVPAFILALSHRYRWRLKRVLPPSESMPVYLTGPSPAWVGATRAARRRGARAGGKRRRAGRAAGSRRGRHRRAAGARVRLRFARHDEHPHAPPAPSAAAAGAGGDRRAVGRAARRAERRQSARARRLRRLSAGLDADLDTLDAALTLQKISHRIYQREIQLPGSAWSGAAAQ